jgi:REP element-mobilizing transposase RayT
MDFPDGWYSRGYLPHINLGAHPQFLTWRLADAVPESMIDRWRDELTHLEDKPRSTEMARRIERYCDAGGGECLLRQPCLARIVQETIFFDHARRFDLHAWTVMPNHVHVLLTPKQGVPLAEILRALKGVSARRINDALGRRGQVWQEDYFDRFMRDGEHFERTRAYIQWNPVKAGLCRDPKHWAWSSANSAARDRLSVVVASRT